MYEIYDDKSENLCKIIRIANFYGSLSVMNACADILLKSMTYETAMEIITLMETDMMTGSNMKDLLKHAESFIMKEFASIDWLHYKFDDMRANSVFATCRKMPYQAIIVILKNELANNTINANILFNFVIDWILHDHDTRNIYMKNFLPLIKFGRMSPFYIRYFLFECFGKYFPNELPVLENIIACTEFFRIYSGENPSMNNRLPKEFDIKNFHNDIDRSY